MAKKPSITPEAPPENTSTEPASAAPTDTADAPAADVDQPAPAEPEAPAEPHEPASAAPVPPLDEFIAHHEKAAQAVDLVVTAITHPDAKPRHHIGVYSGFPIVAGPLSATYNDGSTH